jgi:hypothetical protein
MLKNVMSSLEKETVLQGVLFTITVGREDKRFKQFEW